MYRTTLLFSVLATSGAVPPLVHVKSSQSVFRSDAVRVPVELGVMSRCPDALLCEPIFDAVLQKVGEKVDLELIYVAKYPPELIQPTRTLAVTCLHGPGECAGNVQQLCAAKYSTQWWDFVRCQNARGRYQVGLPEVALECAETVGIDWEGSGVGECAGLDGSGKGEEGVALLRESTLRGKALEIEKSCTVLINHRKVCIHDGTWKECEGGHGVDDFVRQINSEYERLNGEFGGPY
ncbi:hypothetical protein B0H16DRAFT_1658872 [Mycena metata]|uniref:Gamma interferon inducible lysosomal thiol reductase GILT n=1 Tax=Mycena metata TaxID=1033252 RepID=A0AAD7NZB0_9AGAR|nr:hypothetical protein B0H16DRAFT_1658872 [Mycena metata]